PRLSWLGLFLCGGLFDPVQITLGDHAAPKLEAAARSSRSSVLPVGKCLAEIDFRVIDGALLQGQEPEQHLLVRLTVQSTRRARHGIEKLGALAYLLH